MSKENVKKYVEKKQKPSSTHSLLSKRLKKVYPFELKKTTSLLSLSSPSSTLLRNTSESFTISSSTVDQAISSALGLISPDTPPTAKTSMPVLVAVPVPIPVLQPNLVSDASNESVKRCNWISKASEKLYVQFHDECWGPIVRVAFVVGDANGLQLDRNSKTKGTFLIAKQHGSFSGYMWGCMNYKPTINRYKHPRNVPMRTPKAEAISKDLLKHGFRLVGPVIVYSFMQAAGMSIDHLVDCFRFDECVSLAERPWRHV
ncbi:DNA glycosylase [Cynara cardunculus var. scolymus]|uniref:DNA glycosylase n=1 Tax=Cynara cardunculus var. scolymus TaxID=59895 RepID=A0A103XT23_CYNCS|nr:DNA glycosylase [Cynara cardunculus var. scolymus]